MSFKRLMSLNWVNTKTLKKDLHITNILIFFMVAVYPLIVIDGPLHPYSGPRYIILAVVAIIAFLKLFTDRISMREIVYIPLAFFILFLLISSIMAEDLTVSWMGNSYRFTGFSTYVFCVLLFLLAVQHRQPRKVLPLMITCAVVVSVIGLMQYFGVIFDQQDFLKGGFYRPRSTIGNANWLGTYLVFILPASLLYYLEEKRIVWLITTIFIYAGLLVTLTRGVWLAFAIIFIIIALLFFRQNKLNYRFGVLVVVLFLVTVLLLPANDWNMLQRVHRTVDTVKETASLESDEFKEEVFSLTRTIYWLGSFESIKENWAFGVGPDQINMEVNTGDYRNKMHNFYLEIAVSMGLPALLSYLAFLSLFLRRQKNTTGFILLIMVLTYMIQGFTIHDVVQVMPLFWIVLGLLWGNMTRASTGKIEDTALAPGEKEISKSDLETTSRKNNLFIKFIAIPIIVFCLIITAWYFYPSEGTVEISGIETYTGQLRGFSYHGYGRLETNHYVYEGYFKHNHFDGNGTLTYSNGAKYVGEFKSGLFDGEGRFITADGQVIEGNWEKGQLQE